MTNGESHPVPEQQEQQPAPQEAPRRPKTGLIVGVVVGVLALVGGGVALSSALQGDSAPGASPQSAVTGLVDVLNKGDAVGVLDRIHPAEAKAFRDFATTTAGEMKRLEVLRGDADPLTAVGGISAQEVGFDAVPEEKVNDRITVVKLVKGKVAMTEDQSKAPYTEKFLKLLGGQPGTTTSTTTTVDIADVVRRTGKPVRIATVKVGDKWHPSLYYSVADFALQMTGRSWPKESIPAVGAATAEQAVRELVTAAIDGNTRRVIELLPPTEMAVAHDVGNALVVGLSGETVSDTKLVELQTETKDIPGGKRISPRKVVVEIGGQRLSVARDGDCAVVDAGEGTRVLCLDQLVAGMEEAAAEDGIQLPEAAVRTVQSIGRNLLDIGVATVEENGKHYLSPTGTVNELVLTFLRGLDAKSLAELVELGNR
ncbi:flagellar basal body protein FliL [Allokutzneria oryzae]|uniref:Flagellar basal body protein FliL n=1 Tax=Allokutzneria oryzae TaxID=1378989 RepID=A0ABV5ZSQ1_9PSEU